MSYDPSNKIHRKRNSEYQKKWYEENKQKHQANVRKVKQKAKEYVWELKVDGCCIICKEQHPACLDFHHRNESKKLFNIGTAYLNRGFNQIKKEIEKCDLVCGNCHRIYHFNQRRGTPGWGR